MSTAFDVIVCGSLHLDIVVQAPALPRLDETAVGSSWKQVCGGKGGNQAVQAAGHGAKIAMIGRIGNDAFGQTLHENLQNAKVDTQGMSIDLAQGSGMSVAILQDNGEYGAVIVSGANMTIDPASLPSVWSAIGGAKVLVLQNEVPHEVNIAAATTAKRYDAIVVFNAAPARDLSEALIANVDVLVVNRVEAETISGQPVTNRISAIAALPALGSLQRSVVITLGGNGLVVSPKSGTVVQIEARPVKVTSTHGAGDCFVGVLAAELANGASLVEACHMANESAAAFVSRT
jgi:ribokinase